MINVQRASYEKERNANAFHYKISPKNDIQENSGNKIIKDEKISNEIKIFKIKTEFKDKKHDIRNIKNNNKKMFLKEIKNNVNKVTKNERLRFISERNETNSNNKYIKFRKNYSIRTLIKLTIFIIFFKLFYGLYFKRLNNMLEQYLKYNENINNKIGIINQMSAYLFDKIFIYIIISLSILSIIFILFKNKFGFIKEKTRLFLIGISNYIYHKTEFLKEKNESIKSLKLEGDKKLAYHGILVKKNLRKKGKNNIVDNFITIREYIIFNMINALIINLFCFIKCNRINLIYSQISSIKLKIKGPDIYLMLLKMEN